MGQALAITGYITPDGSGTLPVQPIEAVNAILIGVILGPLLETYFLRAMRMSDGDIMVLFSSTLANVLWVTLFVSLAIPYVMDKRRSRIQNR